MHTGFLLNQRAADGGFKGRRGEADLYYTDFALRILSLLGAAGNHDLPAIASFLDARSHPESIVDVFNILNIRRLLAAFDTNAAVDPAKVVPVLQRYQLPGGGFCRTSAGVISAYASFLGILSLSMVSREADACGTADALNSLRCADGGYRESTVALKPEANATAAAVSTIILCGAGDQLDRPAIESFLRGLQAEDGGIRSHDSAPVSDLMSSFTSTVTLLQIDAVDALDLPALARFVRSMQSPGGGFRSCTLDSEPDIEYTYYGLGTLGLLRWHVENRKLKE